MTSIHSGTEMFRAPLGKSLNIEQCPWKSPGADSLCNVYKFKRLFSFLVKGVSECENLT